MKKKYFSATSDDSGHNAQALSFVYPYGATLNVAKPATAVLSTGKILWLFLSECFFYELMIIVVINNY